MKVGLDIFLQSLLNGLVMGGIYALIAVGLTLVFGVMRIINVAHGEFIMVGMYLAYFLNVSLGLDPYLGILVIVPIMFLFGMAFYGFLIKPAVDKPVMNQVMITIGFSIVLVNLALFLLTADYRTLNVGYFNRSFRFFRVMVGLPQLVAFLGSLGDTVALYWVLVHTRMGRMIRAVAQNRKAATLMGIDVAGLLARSLRMLHAFKQEFVQNRTRWEG
jgi:branched-chain amino acid transport system permease protein